MFKNVKHLKFIYISFPMSLAFNCYYLKLRSKTFYLRINVSTSKILKRFQIYLHKFSYVLSIYCLVVKQWLLSE